MKILSTLGLIFLLAGTPSSISATSAEVTVGQQLSNLPMQGLTGNSVLLSDYFGKPLIINVWASYCSPCLTIAQTYRMEM